MNLLNIDLEDATAVELRKIGQACGIKGASKAKKADLIPALIRIQNEQVEAQIAETTLAEKAAKVTSITANAPKAGKCTECGAKEDFRASGLCRPCREFGEWENTHNDEQHGAPDGAEQDGVNTADCPVCNPELDPRNRKPGRSRAGMVVVAKGSEIHKSLVFKKAAEALGWTVEIARETYELPDDAEGEGTRFYATATKTTQLGADDSISLAWDGRAYDYDASSAVLAGKGRKIRNLKEALRHL